MRPYGANPSFGLLTQDCALLILGYCPLSLWDTTLRLPSIADKASERDRDDSLSRRRK